jgi:NADH-quinone oxidoreductase subunit A
VAKAVPVRVRPSAPPDETHAWLAIFAGHDVAASGPPVTIGSHVAKRSRPQDSHAMMLEQYLPILVFLGISAVMGSVLLMLGFALGRGQKDVEKLSPYECGFEAFEDTRTKFDVRYYLVAILFIIFDLEIAFLFPWAVSLDSIGTFGLLAMGVFLAILVVGFIYEWKKGALEWD